MSTTTSNKNVTCLICDAANSSSAVHCRECAAPLSLLDDAAQKKRDPRIVSILGDSNAGKTVYLGFLLDMLSQRARDYEAIPRAGYAVQLQQHVISHMANRLFPPKTPMESNEWLWAYYQVRRIRGGSKWVDLVMPDLAGEAITAEIGAPSTFAVIRNLLAMSGAVLLVVDASLVANGSTQPDFFALKALSYIDSMHAGRGRRTIKLPVAVVLSKADHCPSCMASPERFAEANLKRLWNMCERRFSKVEFFASSVVGSLAYAVGEQDDYVRPIPLHVTPYGVMEPFEWIMDQL